MKVIIPKFFLSAIILSSVVSTMSFAVLPYPKFIQLNRFFSQDLRDHNITSSQYVESDYKFEMQLGRIAYSYEENTTELFECLVNGKDHMLSTNSVCEGNQVLGVAGYIYTTQLPGTKALYRCIEKKDHFASLDSNCEGKTKEGLLGYVY